MLKELSHPRFITFYDSWIDNVRDVIVFITGLMTLGSIQDYYGRVGEMPLSLVKRWAVMILEGLKFLHESEPKIVHRDIKCDNIFLDGRKGQVLIGDLGLCKRMTSEYMTELIGTPEYMAPELFNQRYNEKVDIYAFGMCILEMVTGKIPYSEIKNRFLILQNVRDGILPSSFINLKSKEIKKFIEKCLFPMDERPSASELLQDEFLKRDSEDSLDEINEIENFPTQNVQIPISFRIRSLNGILQEVNLSLSPDDDPEEVAKEIVNFEEFEGVDERVVYGYIIEELQKIKINSESQTETNLMEFGVIDKVLEKVEEIDELMEIKAVFSSKQARHKYGHKRNRSIDNVIMIETQDFPPPSRIIETQQQEQKILKLKKILKTFHFTEDKVVQTSQNDFQVGLNIQSQLNDLQKQYNARKSMIAQQFDSQINKLKEIKTKLLIEENFEDV